MRHDFIEVVQLPPRAEARSNKAQRRGSELCVAHHSSGKAGLDRGAQRDDCHRHYEPQPSRLRWLDGGIEKGRGSRRGRVGRVHGVALRALLASGESQQGSSMLRRKPSCQHGASCCALRHDLAGLSPRHAHIFTPRLTQDSARTALRSCSSRRDATAQPQSSQVRNANTQMVERGRTPGGAPG